MRYDSEHKAQTRERVLQEASVAIRAQGVDKVSVAAIMQRAGLTHGGFYAHFKSKDELVTEAIGRMFDDRYNKAFARADASDPRGLLLGFIDFYLSARHRDAPERGCPIPALNGDVPRLSAAARSRFVAGVDSVVAGVERLLAALERPDPHGLAQSVVAELVGAILLARSNPDPAASDAMLAASKAAIVGRLGLDEA